MSAPASEDWAALVRLTRYLLQRPRAVQDAWGPSGRMRTPTSPAASPPGGPRAEGSCLLYTSDAADDM
eukprot:13671172-Alexandrium_andersonii.AAC.1